MSEKKPLSPYDDLTFEMNEAMREMNFERANQARAMLQEAQLPKVTGLEAWLPITTTTVPRLTQNDDGSLWYGGIRITDATTVTIPSGTFTLYASPDLKRDECYVFQQPKPIDPLDVEYDGVKLRVLLLAAQGAAREQVTPLARSFTPAQRAAVSTHWSAELRAKVDAAKQQDRNQVTMEHNDD